jgi:hypothetical protein
MVEGLRFVNSDATPPLGFFSFRLRLPGLRLRYDVPLLGSGGCGGATGGLYSGAGLAGLLNGLISFFFGFFFSRLRVSRLPMSFSPSS